MTAGALHDAITAVDGVLVGHRTLDDAGTGCTVVILPEGTVASGEVRGGAPATRETALLDPTRTVSRVDAVLLTGGSAFGLAAADGVMRWCEEEGRGQPTRAGVPVPIVVGLGLFDLDREHHHLRPGADDGYAACEAASSGPVATGRVGAGRGARLARYLGVDESRPGGVATATAIAGDVVVGALLVVNAVGDLALRAPADLERFTEMLAGEGDDQRDEMAATVVGVVATNAALTKVECHLVAQGGHDGLARALDPPHTTLDGDALVAASCGEIDAPFDVVRALAVRAVSQAVAGLE